MILQAIGVIALLVAGEPLETYDYVDHPPKPSTMAFGALAGDHMLAYVRKGDPFARRKYLDENNHYVDGVYWYWSDLKQNKTTLVATEFPETAKWFEQDIGWMCHPGYPSPHRWRLAPRYFWSTCCCCPNYSLSFPSTVRRMGFPAENVSNNYTPRAVESGASESPNSGDQSSMLARLPVGHYGEGLPISVADLRDVVSKGYDRHVADAKRAGRYCFDFDILPIAEDRVEAIVMVDDRVSIWENHFTVTPELRLQRRKWTCRDEFACRVGEPFHVAKSGDVYFLVTDSGKVISAEKVDQKWQTKALWKDEKRPVRAMLVESDGRTGFVFGRDFYMKLGRDQKPNPCRDVTQGPKEPGEPVATLVECGRVLLEKGELAKPDARR